MKVNCKKTQLLIDSPPNGFENDAFISIRGEKIISSDKLKLLGFMFGKDPNVGSHVAEIKRKFRSRYWALIHLRKSGFLGKELFKLYNVFVRPVIEYCCVVYHPLLTRSQTQEIERLQKQVAKLAYGWDRSYQVICEEENIQTPQERREQYIDKFVAKTLKNPRFNARWFLSLIHI